MKLIIQFLFLIGTFSLIAQNRLSGKITDENNKPLLGVDITIAKLNKGTTSDINGNYVLKNILNGKITVVFSFIGYKKVVKKMTFNSENKTFNLQLKKDSFVIDEVIISTPFNQLQSDNVMKVERLDAKSIRRTGATTLIRGLANIPGVSQVSTGVSIGKPVIRGLNSNQIVTYTQGIRLENQQFGGEHGLGINDAGIGSAEVIKGPASLLYGSDAIGGVLYMNPEKFAFSNQTHIFVNQRFASNTLGSNTSVAIKTSTNNWKFLARGTYDFHADYKIPTGQRITNTRFKEQDIKAGIQFNKNNFLSEIRYNYNYTLIGLPEDGITEQTKVYTPEAPFQKIYNHVLSWKNQILFKNSKLEGTFGYIHNDRNEFENFGKPSLEMVLKTLSYNIKYHLPKLGKKVNVIFGIQGMHQNNTNLAEEMLIPDATVRDFGVFGVVNYLINDKNNLQAGVRFDTRGITTKKNKKFIRALDKSFNNFTASFGYKTDLIENLTLRFNASTGFRSPNLAELSSNGVHEGTFRFEQGNENLKIEKNIQGDLSLSYRINHFELFANPFYNKIDNYIYIAPTGLKKTQIDEDGQSQRYDIYNFLQNDAKLYGGEFGFHLHPHPLDWLHLESSFETVTGKQDNGNYLPFIPANTWKNTVRTTFNIKNWLQQGYALLSFNATFAQKKASLFETKSKAYNLINIGIGGDIILGKYIFNTSLSVNNLFDKKYISHLSRLKPERLLNPGRNIVIGVNFKI